MRVVRILTRPNLGGPMLQAVALWHSLRAFDVQTLLVVGECDATETAVALDDTSSSPPAASAPRTRRR